MAEPERKLMMIPLSKIRENPIALRSVNRTDEKYMELVDSIKARGVLSAISVREVINEQTKEVFYSLIDGLQRYSASQDAGKTEIPAQVISMSDGEVLEAQIIANVQKIETRPVEYSKQLLRILAGNPFLTIAELSAKLSKSTTWLTERLSLNKLPPEIATLVDEGRVNLTNAYSLAKLAQQDPKELAAYLERAQTMSPQEFVGTVTSRVKELRDAKRQGRDASTATFVPTAHLRKLSELKSEMETPQVGPLLLKKHNVTHPHEAFQLGLKWALHQDPESIQAAIEKEEARKKQAEEDKKKREAERTQKKEEEARARALKAGDLAHSMAPSA